MLDAGKQDVKLIQHHPMSDLRYQKLIALDQINEIRSAVGISRLSINHALERAAQSHADYLVINHTSTHREYRSSQGFTAKTPMGRALVAGYHARWTGENISTKNKDAYDSISGLMSAIYHRFGFLESRFDEIGIGVAQDTNDPTNSAFVYLMGNSEVNNMCQSRSYKGNSRYVIRACADKKHRIEAKAYRNIKYPSYEFGPAYVLYPYDGQVEVPPAFYDESPDPLPGYDVSGFPVSIEFLGLRDVRLVAFKIYDASGKQLKRVKLLNRRTDPNHQLSKTQYALMPLDRLKYDTLYRAEAVYIDHKKRQTISWSFRTITPRDPLITIERPKESITLIAGHSYWLYFKPTNPHDLLPAMKFPADVYVRFVDNNTMRIVLEKDKADTFTIRGGKKELKINVEHL